MASAMLSDCASSAASRLLPLQGAIRTKALYLHRSIPWLRMAVPGRSRSTAALPHWRLSDVSPVSMATETSAKIIDGKSVAKQIRDEIAGEIAKMKDAIGIVPGLAVILVGSRKDSQTYVCNRKKAGEAVGITSYEIHFSEDSTEEEVLKHIYSFNIDPSVHGILIQLPLPRHMNEESVLNAVSIEKDVDGFHLLNIGRLAMQGREPLFVPCTPKECMELLHREKMQPSALYTLTLRTLKKSQDKLI